MSSFDFIEVCIWLTTNYQLKVGGMVTLADIYTKAMEFFVPPRLTPTKTKLSRMIISLFPDCKRTIIYKKRIEYTSFTGLVERCKISTDDTSVLIPSECKAGKDSLGNLMITCPTLNVVNGKIVTCTVTFGKTLCLLIRGASLHIQQKIDMTQSSVDGLVYLCKNLKLCKGWRCDENYQTSQYGVKEYWASSCTENQIDQRVRSSVCDVILYINSKVELCEPCRRILNRQNKRKVEEEDDACIVPDVETREDNITPVETPTTKLEPNGMVAEAPEVMLTPNADTEMDKLLKVVTLCGAPAKFGSLLESQLRNNKETDPRHRRWNPDVINLCLSLYSRSPSAYQTLKSSGFLTLPSKRLLQYYKNSVHQPPPKKKKKKMFTKL